MQAVLWIEIALLCALALLPAALAGRRPGTIRDHHAPALALHRAQLRELDRDRADGLIEAGEQQAARLEVQRRLLAAAAEDLPPPRVRRRRTVVPALLPVAPIAIGLYLLGGHPTLPAQPDALRLAQAGARLHQDDALIASLRHGLASLDPATQQTRQGYLLLGQAEASRGHWAAAAAAWTVALGHGYDPTLAVQVAEAQSQAEGAVSPASAALFRHALDAAPADAPWRQLAEERLAQSEHR